MTARRPNRFDLPSVLLGLLVLALAGAAGTTAKPAAGPDKPAASPAKPADTQPKPADAQPKPVVAQPKPAGAEAKPADTPAKPPAGQPKPAYKASELITWNGVTPSDADRAMFEQVVTRLLGAAEPVKDFAWPPRFVIDASTEPNANSSLKGTTGGKPQPVVTVHRGWLDKVVQGVETRLVEVLSHELGHILLQHVGSGRAGTPIVSDAIQREREFAADAQGLALALKANYSYADYIEAWKWEYKLAVAGKYTAFEGLNFDHPSDAERIAHIATDDVQKKLWRSTAAFEEGVYFLTSEQYTLAERCFRQVTADFPSCYEGWANLGYARLMTYCDALRPEDLRTFNVGQLVVGGFYRRARGLESRPAGLDEKLWFDAVGALREAIRIKPDLILAKANLAVAYLVRPAGKDVGAAAELFDQVVKALSAGHPDEPLDPLTTASLLVNVGVAEQSAGHADLSQKFFDQATAELKKIGTAKTAAVADSGAVSVAATSQAAVSQAITYNRAFMMAASSEENSRRSAVKDLEAYLRSGNSAQTWWTLAYDRYAVLCKQLSQAPLNPEKLSGPATAPLRLVTDLPLSGGITIRLTDNLSDVIKLLGQGTAIPVVRNTDVQRVRYPDRGLDLLATDEVLAIDVHGDNAPAVPVRVQDLAGTIVQLRIGMTQKELDELLQSEAGFQEPRPFTNPSVKYRFYRRLGLGVLVEDGKVSEILIAQLPKENSNPYAQGQVTAPLAEPKRPTLE